MKKRIMIDLDDVIVNQDGWIRLVNEFLKTNFTIDDVKGYYIQDLVPPELKDEFTKFFISKNVYDYGNVHKDCIDVIKKLNDKYDVYVCSAYEFRDNLLYCADSLKYKFEFLIKNFPFLNIKNILFSNDKSIIDCDIKIDDKLSNLEGAETKILYLAYHNKNIDRELLNKNNVIVVKNWKDIEKILL